MQLEALARPESGERRVQPLEEPPAPGRILARRVVANQIVRRAVRLEAGQLAQKLLRELLDIERLKSRVILPFGNQLLGQDRPQHAVGRQQHQAAVLGRDEQFARHVVFLTVAAKLDVLDAHARAGAHADRRLPGSRSLAMFRNN